MPAIICIANSQLFEMFKLQDEANLVLGGPDWAKLDWNIYSAIQAELGELVTHLNYKWWNPAKPINWRQVRVELIDILHFVLMDHIKQSNDLDSVVDYIQVMQTELVKDANWELVNGISEADRREAVLAVASEVESQRVSFRWLLEMWALIDGSSGNSQFINLYRMYIAKRVLNDFRWDNGYTTGGYTKNWFGQEDNDVMLDILENTPNLTKEGLYCTFDIVYKDYVLSGHSVTLEHLRAIIADATRDRAVVH